ncbi:two-component system histidine kinase PnpS [Kurthia massiliensis]|uniref:two-component system histidine kinase PnpS n=1 Tax=Kurthia massiliensis TaxID=1033739 RepID=UPI000289D3D6|nr:ATP-binding protein [Kurthia massiliensis]
MKSMRLRLLIAFGFLYGTVLACLAFVLGQLLPAYIDTSTVGETTASSPMMNSLYFWLFYIGSFVIAFVVMLLLTNRILYNVMSSVDHVTNTALELAKGNYRARAYEARDVPTSALSRSINVLARNLQDMMMTREIEQERLKTLIENMGSALIMIGREGDISVVNRVFLDLFDKQHDIVTEQVFRDLGMPAELEEFVDHVFMTEEAYRQQIQLPLESEIRHMEVYGAPVIGEHGHWLGVVIVMHDITELKKLEQVRKDFVANVSHELRTPITSMKGFSETLLDGAYKDEETLLTFLEIMNKESNRLQMLVNDLLELSKLEKHGFVLDLLPTNLNDLVRRATELSAQRLSEKDMALVVEAPTEITVLGDANRLMQVIVNLLFNAISYSPEATKVTMTLREDEQYGILEVHDEGIGISKEEIPRVFERFYRVDRARSRNSGGTGLGLAIVKHLVEIHHGKIQVDSEVGKGTTMRVMLPKQAT